MTEAPDVIYYDTFMGSSDTKPHPHDDDYVEYVRCTLHRLKDLERVAELARNLNDRDFLRATSIDDLHAYAKELKELLSKLNGGGDGNG